MRNLKRALSLVMAMALIVGMMVVSASAAGKDFTDKDEIEHTEAVEVMAALNVISGKEDGSYYDPTGTLTRAEMAKIVAFVMNGGVEPNIGTKLVPTYSDIDNHWAEAYIEYCTSMGIINGDGAGKFNPNGTLTASQTAKMFLTAMGYNAEVFGLVGNDWETNTNRYANEAGLYEDLGNVGVSDPISRDDAAQMAYNAIQATLMERTWSQNQTTGQITEGYELSRTGKTLLSERFGGKIFIGTFDGNHETNESGTREGEIAVTGYLTTDTIVTSGSDKTSPRTAILPSDLDISNIGEEVKVIFKDGTSGRSGTPDRNDTIYGVFNTGSTQVVNATVADINDELTGANTATRVEIADVLYDVAAPEDDETTIVSVNYGASTVTAKDNTTNKTAVAEATKEAIEALAATNGDTVKFVCNDEGKIFRAYVVNTKIAAVTAVNDEKVTINSGVSAITIADNDVYDGIAKGDVVTVTTLYNTDASSEDAYSVVAKAEVVSGSVNSFKEGKSVNVGGTSYPIYNEDESKLLKSIPDVASTDLITAFNDTYIGEDVNLYLVNGYVGAAVQTSEGANNYSVITSIKGVAGDSYVSGTDSVVTAEDAWNPLELQILAADGTKTTIAVSEDSTDENGDKKVTNEDYSVGDIIVYTGSDDAAVVTVKSAAKGGAYNDSTKTFGGTVTSASCVLFATDDKGAWNVYNIRDLDSIEAVSGSQAVTASDRVVAVSMKLGKTPAGATSNTVYGIVTSYDGTVKVDDTTKRQYTVASNEETYTLYMPAASTAVAAGDLVAFAPTSDDTYADNDVDVITSGAVYVDEYSETDSTLTFFTTVVKGSAGEYTGVDRNTLALDDDCAIVYVDADGDAAGSDIGIGEFDSVNGYKNAAIVTKEVDGEDIIVAIFVETSGECDILSSTLSEGMTDSQIKDLDDGIYVPADGDFTTSGNVTGNPEDNIIVKFTVKEATTKVSLSVSDGTTEYMNSGSPLEFTGLDWAADSDHFIFFHVYGGDNNPDLSAGGTFTVTVKDVDNNSTLYSGLINVAPKGE